VVQEFRGVHTGATSEICTFFQLARLAGCLSGHHLQPGVQLLSPYMDIFPRVFLSSLPPTFFLSLAFIYSLSTYLHSAILSVTLNTQWRCLHSPEPRPHLSNSPANRRRWNGTSLNGRLIRMRLKKSIWIKTKLWRRRCCFSRRSVGSTGGK